MHFLFKGLFDVSEYAGRSSKKVTVMKAGNLLHSALPVSLEHEMKYVSS